MSGDDVIGASTMQDVRELLLLYNHFVEHQSQFLPTCQEWMNYRKNTIEIIDEFLSELINIGTGSAIECGIAVDVDTIAPSSLGIGASYLPIGSLCTSAQHILGNVLYTPWKTCLKYIGGLSNGIACDNLVWKNKNLFKDMNNALREDQLHIQMFYSWFQKSQELEILLQRVFGCSILSETFYDIFNALEELKFECEQAGPNLITIISVLSGNEHLSENLNSHVVERVIQHSKNSGKRYLLEFCTNYEMRQTMLSLLDSLKIHPSPLRLAKIAVSLSNSCLSMRGQYEGILLSLPTSDRDLFDSASQLTQDVFTTIPLAILVLSFISGAKDVLEDTSKYINILNSVKNCLLNELNFFLKEMSFKPIEEL